MTFVFKYEMNLFQVILLTFSEVKVWEQNISHDHIFSLSCNSKNSAHKTVAVSI